MLKDRFFTKDRPEQVHVGDVLACPSFNERRRNFDVEKEIGEGMSTSLIESARMEDDDVLEQRCAFADLMFLFPEKMEFLKTDELYLPRLQRDIDLNLQASELNSSGLAEMLYQKKVIWKADLSKFRYKWEDFRTWFWINQRGGLAEMSWPDFLFYAVDLKVCFPDLTQELLDEDLFKKIVAQIPNDRTALGYEYGLMLYLSNARILFPERFDEQMCVSAEMWHEMYSFFSRMKARLFLDWSAVVATAFSLKVLAAEKVSVTENGLEIEMLKGVDFNQSVQPLPQLKSFADEILNNG